VQANAGTPNRCHGRIFESESESRLNIRVDTETEPESVWRQLSGMDRPQNLKCTLRGLCASHSSLCASAWRCRRRCAGTCRRSPGGCVFACCCRRGCAGTCPRSRGGFEGHRERTLPAPGGWSEHSRRPDHHSPNATRLVRRRPRCAQVRRPAKAQDDMPVRQAERAAQHYFGDGRTDGQHAQSESNPGARVRITAQSTNHSRISESQPNLRIKAGFPSRRIYFWVEESSTAVWTAGGCSA
jgi:hypothetical protein